MFQGQENVWSPVFFSPCTPPTKKICEACIKFLTMYRKLTKHKMTILSKMNTLGEVPEPIFPGDEIFLNMWIVATVVNVRSSSFWKLYRHTTFKSNQLEHNDTKKRIGIKHGSKFRIPQFRNQFQSSFINRSVVCIYSDLFLWGACRHLNLIEQIFFCLQKTPGKPLFKGKHTHVHM